MAHETPTPPLRQAVVVGAFGGIGAATVARLVAEGWEVLALDRPQAVAGDTLATHVLEIDVADPASIARCFEAVAQIRRAIERFVDPTAQLQKVVVVEVRHLSELTET